MEDKLSKIRAEIERRLAGDNLYIYSRREYTDLLSFIDSLQKEPISGKKCMFSKDNYTDEDRKVLCEGCEEECKFNKKEEPVNDDLEGEINRYLSTWSTSKDNGIVFCEKMARHFAAWQKQQMMAKAVDATVHIDAGGYPYIPQMELYDYDKDIPLAKEGDKYKAILIKEG